ncbi:MAG: hypothetical protein JSR44_04690 [Spirochaetes bacterium]|nr:hypothetical protein [Spirochaetota bacterium]
MNTQKIFNVAMISFVIFTTNCSNISLYDKLANPGGTTGSRANETFTTNYYAFTSSWTTVGDMSGQPYAECVAAPDGVARADCACTRAAAENGLRKNSGQQYYAYLGNKGINLEARCRIARLSAGCSPSAPGPWFNTIGQIVVNTFSELSGSLQNSLQYDAKGNLVGTVGTWTGAGASGNAQDECGGNWVDGSGALTASTGDNSKVNTSWQYSGSTPLCNNPNRIYCFATP